MTSILHTLQKAVKAHIEAQNWPIEIISTDHIDDLPPIYRLTVVIEPLIPEMPQPHLPELYFEQVKLKLKIIHPKHPLDYKMNPMGLAEALCKSIHGFEPHTTGTVGHFTFSQPMGWSHQKHMGKHMHEVYQLQFHIPIQF